MRGVCYNEHKCASKPFQRLMDWMRTNTEMLKEYKKKQKKHAAFIYIYLVPLAGALNRRESV